MKKLLLLLLMSAAISYTSKAQNADAIVDSLFHGRHGFVHDSNVIGGMIGIYSQGHINYYAYGYMAKDKSRKVDTSTIFEIGSNTKVFTALLLANEMLKGTVDTNTYIDKYMEVNSKLRKRVRLVDLATHSSGLPTLHDSLSMIEITAMDSLCPYCAVDDKYLLSLLKRTDTLDGYGHFNYSNYGFALLGYALSSMNHTGYCKLLTKSILQPLHMNNTSCEIDTSDTRTATGYEEGERQDYMTLTGLAPAGVIKSDIRDMMHFVQYEIDEAAPLSKAIRLSQKVFFKDDEYTMALGWPTTRQYGDNLYMMRGDTYGFSSVMGFDKDKKVGIVALLNCKNSDLTEHIFSYFINQAVGKYAKPDTNLEKPIMKLNADVLKLYTGDYKIMEGLSAKVFVENNDLYVQLTGQPKGLVEAVASNIFIEKAFKAEFEFVKDTKGVYSKMILRQHGREIHATRTE